MLVAIQSAHTDEVRKLAASLARKGALAVAFAGLLNSMGVAHAVKPVCDAGTLDPGYGVGGIVQLTQPYTPAVSPEGILLNRKDRTTVPVDSAVDGNGNFTISLLRTTEKGVADRSFGVEGRVVVGAVPVPVNASLATTLAEDAAGRILFLVASNLIGTATPITGMNAVLTVYRYLEDGQQDMTFGNAGAAVIGGLNTVWPITSMATDAGSRVLIALGAANPAGTRIESTVIRLDASGALDSTFGNGGIAQAALNTTGPDRATDVQVQADGSIIVLGRTHTSAFGPGTTNTDWDYFAIRFLPNGSLDAGYGTNGSTIIDFGPNRANGRKGRLQSDGKLVIAGNVLNTSLTPYFAPYSGWVRLNVDGSRDTTFGTVGQASVPIGPYGGVLIDMALQDDGKIVGAVAEFLDADGSNTAAGVLRINADGTTDTTYGGDGVASIVPGGYLGAGVGYLRVDSKSRAILSFRAGLPEFVATQFLARFEPGKCK